MYKSAKLNRKAIRPHTPPYTPHIINYRYLNTIYINLNNGHWDVYKIIFLEGQEGMYLNV